jgi:hypothetical protein
VRNIERTVAAGLELRAGIIETDLNAGHSPAARVFLESLGVTNIKVDIERGVGRGSPSRQSSNPMAELCGECWKGKLCVTASDQTYPCVFSRFLDLGSAKAGVESMLVSDPLRQFRTAIQTYKSAQSCNPDQRCNPTCSPCSPDTFRGCMPIGEGPRPLEPCAPARCAPSR